MAMGGWHGQIATTEDAEDAETTRVALKILPRRSSSSGPEAQSLFG